MENASGELGQRPGAARPTRGELTLILAFWTFFAVVTAASRLLDPRGPGTGSPVAVRFAWLAVAEAGVWALLTVPLFMVAHRIGAHGRRSATTILLLLASAIVVAIVANVVVASIRWELLRDVLSAARARRGNLHRGPRLFDPISTLQDVVTALGILAAGLARDYSRRYRARQAQTARLEAQLAEARLDALRRQLDPHFLFNTLNAVSSLVERDPRGVRRMIARLSDLLRFSIEGSDAPEMSLERELELLQRYLDIMQVRFQGRLEVAIDADATARSAMVPSMILQPIVENAIKHGVSQLEGVGRITIDARVENRELVVRVSDNGPGLQGRDTSLATEGVGLRNTRSRLEQLYAGRARLTIGDHPGGGAEAELVIPFHTAAA